MSRTAHHMVLEHCQNSTRGYLEFKEVEMQGSGPVSQILEKYSRKLESELSYTGLSPQAGAYSREYFTFREEMIPILTKYEKWAKSLGNVIKIRAAEKDRVRIQRFLNIAHLDVSSSQAITLSIIAMLGVFFASVLIAIAIYLINGTIQLSFTFLGVMASMFVFYYTYSMPQRLANTWRLKTSAQMVPAILYIVVYMKHTSNLERAIEFASQHLEGPLALDLKKIFYDVEIGRYSTIKQSLEGYLVDWRDYAPEFIESFHLIESSLFEPSETRRVEILEKALQVILDGIYEKMLQYTREIRTPLTNVYMLGIILPTLGLALLPLASTLLQGAIKWPHILILFNIIIPFFVFYLVSEVLLKRPGGYGETSSMELNPYYAFFRSRKVWVGAFILALPFFILGILPFLFQSEFFVETFNLKDDYTFGDLKLGFFEDVKLFDFKTIGGKKTGPFGPVAVLLSLFVPLSLVLLFSIGYLSKTKRIIKTRDNTKKLENEFANSLFQLGNRLADGHPAEIAFGQVAASTQGQKSSEFFYLVSANIQQGGMPLERAVFDRRRGAILYYPSALIATSMKILLESVKKGLNIASRSLMSISEYVNNIKKINQRLKDLLAEIVSDMKSNMTFLAPLLAGIVVGLATMITFILNKLENLQIEGGENALDAFGGLGGVLRIFDVSQMIPPYFIQLSVGIYIIEVIFILTGALVTVDAGKDPIKEKYDLGKNLRRGFFLYLITAFIAIFALSVLASVALGGLN